MLSEMHSCALVGVTAFNLLQLLHLLLRVKSIRGWLVLLEFHNFFSKSAPLVLKELARTTLDILAPIRVLYVFGTWDKSLPASKAISEVLVLFDVYRVTEGNAILVVSNRRAVERVPEGLVLDCTSHEAYTQASLLESAIHVCLPDRRWRVHAAIVIAYIT